MTFYFITCASLNKLNKEIDLKRRTDKFLDKILPENLSKYFPENKNVLLILNSEEKNFDLTYSKNNIISKYHDFNIETQYNDKTLSSANLSHLKDKITFFKNFMQNCIVINVDSIQNYPEYIKDFSGNVLIYNFNKQQIIFSKEIKPINRPSWWKTSISIVVIILVGIGVLKILHGIGEGIQGMGV